MNMIKMTFLYIWDFCKFLFESNATQTTKIHLIKYTVVIFLVSSLFICSCIFSVRLKQEYSGIRIIIVFIYLFVISEDGNLLCSKSGSVSIRVKFASKF